MAEPFYLNSLFQMLYSIAIVGYLGFLLALRTHKIKPRIPSKYLDWMGPAIGAGIGMVTLDGTVLENIVAGGIIIGLFMIFIPGLAFIWLVEKIIAIEEKETNLKKLKLSKDYLEVLNSAGIYSVEDLTNVDITNIPDELDLSTETMIDLREKARKILKK